MYEVVVTVEDKYKLLFLTNSNETVAICDELEYFKQVARHEPSKTPFKNLSKSVEHLFKIYIEDLKLHIPD